MEEQLRTRRVASASVRKQRMQERQKHKDLMAEQREEWRKRRQRYSVMYKPASDDSRSNSPENDSSVESPSEDSVPTPGSSISPDVEFNISISDLTLERFTRKPVITDDMLTDKTKHIQDWSLKTKTFAVVPDAPLTRPSVLPSKRFSTIIDTIGIDISPHDVVLGATSSESEDSLGEDSDTDYEYSPIEIATPITFCVPVSKPNVISVKSTTSTSSTSSPRTSISTNNSQHMSQSRSAGHPRDFQPSYAEPLAAFVPISSVISVTPSSDGSSSTSDHEDSSGNVRRKSSVPMLSKFTHARMNSFKKLIKPQSISGSPPAVPAIPVVHHVQSSYVIRSVPASPSAPSPIYLNKISGEYETIDQQTPPRRSFTEPMNQLRRASTAVRPQTAYPSHSRTNSARTSHENTKRSSVDVQDVRQDAPIMKRKKSFSNLRRRSGSLGQVLKLSNDKSKSPVLDSNPPPVPVIKASNYAAFGNGPTPSPRKSSRTMTIGMPTESPFLSHNQVRSSVGLGLRL